MISQKAISDTFSLCRAENVCHAQTTNLYIFTCSLHTARWTKEDKSLPIPEALSKAFVTLKECNSLIVLIRYCLFSLVDDYYKNRYISFLSGLQ